MRPLHLFFSYILCIKLLFHLQIYIEISRLPPEALIIVNSVVKHIYAFSNSIKHRSIKSSNSCISQKKKSDIEKDIGFPYSMQLDYLLASMIVTARSN